MTIYYEESRISSITFVKTENDLKLDLQNSSNLIINPKISIPIATVNETNYLFKIQELTDERENLTHEIELSKEEIEIIKSNSSKENEVRPDSLAFNTSSNTTSNETFAATSTNYEQQLNSDIQIINNKISELNNKIENNSKHIIEINNTISDIKKQINAQADIELQKIIDNLQNVESISSIIINAESPIFHDIEFSIDSNKVEINSQSVHQEPLSGISLGNSVMLDSLMEQHFVILPGRKSSNIKSNLNQNHGCIDAIAINGLMNSPKIMSEYSVGKLIDAISKNKKLKDLDIYIIHSALKVNIITYHGLSDVNIPCYAIGKGEILSVFFRYLALTFFPYMTICDSSESLDYKYDI